MGDNKKGQRQLLEIMQELESLESERKQTAAKVVELLSHAEGEGFEKKALKQLLKERAGDMEKTAKLRVMVDRYRKELGAFGDTELGEWASASMAAINTARKERSPKLLNKNEDGETVN